jgi:hypothetical protein
MRDEFVSNLSKYLKTNWSVRRLVLLFLGLSCVLVCVAVVVGWLDLPLWQTIGLLVVGLIAIEWAG